MKHPCLFLACLLSILVWSCKPEAELFKLIGTTRAPNDIPLLINGELIQVSPEGNFNYESNAGKAQLLNVSFGAMEWTLFISPGKQVELHVKDQDLGSISYGGDYQSANEYLLSTLPIGEKMDLYFNQNWMRIHGFDQPSFVWTVDSLKSIYLSHMQEAENQYNLAASFMDVWKAEVNYSFNALILRYPERFLQFPPVPIELSQTTWEYLNETDVDCPNFINLPGYQSYTTAWIEVRANELVLKETSSRHYNLRMMDQMFKVIDQAFESQELKDHWKSLFLKEHMEKQGFANAQPYLDQFFESLKTEGYREPMEKIVEDIKDSRKDHQVSIYKSENGFKLEAHVFQTQTPSETTKPAIVIFHGGGWNGGNPSWAFHRAKHFADHGMVAVAAQYRLTNEHDITAREAMDDARDLILWMRQHADSLNLDPNRIAGYGWSAGAHLVSSAAFFPETDPQGKFSSVPDVLLLVSPAVSLPKGEGWKSWTYNVLGSNPRMEEVNPVSHVRSGLPPTCIVQGRDDSVTPLEGVSRFAEKMLAHGNRCELYVYDGVGHLFTPSTMPDNGWPRPDQEVQKEAFNQLDLFLGEMGYLNSAN